jgi:hypothetical protein
MPLSRASEKPVSSDSIVDSVGMNVHLHYTNTPYANFPLVQSLLTDLKVRHIRDGVVDTTWAEYYKRHNALGKLGIHCLYVTSPKQSDALLASYPDRVRFDFEGYEAPNEYNNSGDHNWPDTLKGFLPRLYRITKSISIDGGHAILVGPSLTQPDAFPKMTGVQQYFDYANLHNYSAGRNPGTTGWGGGGYGSIEWNKRQAHGAWADAPIMSTEIGFTTDPGNKQGIPEDVEAKYIPRLILEQLLHHIDRTYIYELIDVGPKVSKNDAAFGLVRNDGSKKPAYTALKGLTSIAADAGSAPRLEDLPFDLAPGASDLHHLLAQRGDGTYLLFFWIEEPCFNPDSKKMQPVPARPVTFSSPARFRSMELLTFSSDGSVSAHKIDKAGAIPLEATDSVSVLRLTPAAGKR